MRWDDLFADLEAQADALEVAERAAEVSERARIEFGALGLIDRLRPAVGGAVRLGVAGGLRIAGTLQRVGSDWLLVDEGAGREALVAVAAVHAAHGLGRESAVPAADGVVFRKLGLRTALRGIARDRSAVRIHFGDGEILDATIDRVGADFVEVARHAAHEPRRRGEVREVVLVPIGVLAVVRRASA